MYAVVNDRNQQFKAVKGSRVRLDYNADWEAGNTVTFDKVHVVSDGEGSTKVGSPFVDGAKVTAEVVKVVKGPKLTVQYFRRRKNSRTRTGFRARYTEVLIQDIA